MSGDRIFVDTNILIYLLQGDPEISQLLDGKQLSVSFITELELLAYPGLTNKEVKSIRNLIADCLVVGYNSDIRDHTVALKIANNLKLTDAIIAASSYHTQLPLFTADKSFGKIKDLDIILYEV